MTLQTEGYSALTEEVQKRVSTAWGEYRDSIGLEGEKYFNLIRSGNSHSQALIMLEEERENREMKIKIWESLWLK